MGHPWGERMVLCCSVLGLECLHRLNRQKEGVGIQNYKHNEQKHLRIWCIYVPAFTHMSAESYCRQFRCMLCMCNIFQVLINSSCIDSTCESSVFQVCKAKQENTFRIDSGFLLKNDCEEILWRSLLWGHIAVCFECSGVCYRINICVFECLHNGVILIFCTFLFVVIQYVKLQSNRWM